LHQWISNLQWQILTYGWGQQQKAMAKSTMNMSWCT
jgi:hypothetical protein